MSTNVIQPSYSAGELSPTLYGRVDLAKYRVGLARMRNFFVDFRGGASNRTGTKFVGAALSWNRAVRLIPFQFSALQSYALEFGNLYMRVIRNGAYILDDPKTVSAVTLANPAVFTSTAHGYSNGDWVYLSDFVGPVSVNRKTYVVKAATTDTFQLEDVFGQTLSLSGAPAFVSGTVARYYTLTTPWFAEDLATLKFVQSADIMTLTHPSYPPQDLARTADNSWALTAVAFGATITPPTSGSTSSSLIGTAAHYSYVITAVSADGEESQGSNPITGNHGNITTTSGTVTIAWSPVDGAAYYNVYRAQIAASAVPLGSQHGYVGTSYGVKFQDTNIIADYTKTPPLKSDPFAPNGVQKIAVTAGGTGYTDASVVSITTSTGTGFKGRAVQDGGVLKAIIIDDPGQNYAPTDTVGVSVGTGATFTLTLRPATGTYPGTVTYFQQRKVFGASFNQPQTLWATKVGNYKNMDKSNPVVASDSITATLASQQVNDIKHMISMPGGLVVLTGGGAWQLSGGGQNTAMTPINAIATPQAYSGCSDVPPLVVNYDILYVQSKGSTVRDLSYNFFTNIYTGTDVSILSNHLLNPHRIVEWAWAEEPFKVIWSVRDDGNLLSTTFVKEQEVIGWARHDTQGLFKSVCSVQEGQENAVYFVVQRYIRGQWVQYVERLASRTQIAPDDLYADDDFWFVDCGLDLPLAYPAANITFSGSTGLVTCVASAPVFAVGDVGKVIRANGGVGTITQFNNTSSVTVNFTTAQTAVLSDGTPAPVVSGDWSVGTLTTTVTGLDHLEGRTVKIVGDGSVFPDQVVSNGSVSISEPCSRIIVGLGYSCQLQTMPLDTGEPTSQGKRKKISAVSLKLVNSRGLKVGPTFDDLTELKVEYPYYGIPPRLVTGTARIIIDSAYTVEGQFCMEQDFPLPVTVLAHVPEITLGDT